MRSPRKWIVLAFAWLMLVAIMLSAAFAALGMFLAWNGYQFLRKADFAEFLLVFVIAAEGACAWVHFHQERSHKRAEVLDELYREFDTKKAREARRFIYSAAAEHLRLAYLSQPKHRENQEY